MIRKLFTRRKRTANKRGSSRDTRSGMQRQARFEQMEPRRMLDADPLMLGAVYIESDTGSDSTPDTIEVAFTGGGATTRLESLSIHTEADIFFDTAAGGRGAAQAMPFVLNEAESVGITAADIQSIAVADGGRTLEINIRDFSAGDKLVFTIDVDEDEGLNGDPIASGAEFELSTLDATFTDDNYRVRRLTPATDPDTLAANKGQLVGNEDGVFWDFYDGNFAAAGLTGLLPPDSYDGGAGGGTLDFPDRTAGAAVEFELTPLPVSISGTVFHDRDRDLTQDTGDEGIANVTLMLFQQDNQGVYQAVQDAQGNAAITTTDGNGDYSFGINDGLDLYPGTYRVVEIQPSDYEISVGAIPGTVTPDALTAVGQASGTNIISEITIPLGNRHAVDYDFAESNPVEIHGHVYLSDEDGNCLGPDHVDSRPVAGATVYLVSDQGQVLSTTTNADGEYWFTSADVANGYLLPGEYTIIEVTPENLLDGDEHVGTVNGGVNGANSSSLTTIQLANGSQLAISDIVQVSEQGRLDFITSITLASGDTGVHYDFCEHEPASIWGYVYHDADDDGVFDNGESPIAGVEMQLLDSNGNQVGTTTLTDSDGSYHFTGLPKGNYTVVQLTQPSEYFDGKDTPGTINGVQVGSALTGPDRIINIDLGYGQRGMNYNFGEVLGSLSGNVHLSNEDGDCYGPGHPEHRPIEGVVVYLVNNQGDSYRTTTDANGDYTFTNIRPGEYSIIEVTPANLLDGSEHVGTINGQTVGDTETVVDIDDSGPITELRLSSGAVIRVANFDNISDLGRLDVITDITMTNTGKSAIDYDFCEHEFASLSGHVFEDFNDNGVFDQGETPIQGALVRLLNQNGDVVRQPVATDSSGYYEFTGLALGTYVVEEVQPNGYFDGKDAVGTINGQTIGDTSRFPATIDPQDDGYLTIRNNSGDVVEALVRQDPDQITAIDLKYGQHGVDYDFGEIPPSRLTGFVYHDSNNNGNFDFFERGLANVPIEIRLTFENGFSDVLLTTAHVVDPSLLDANGRYVVYTDANGFYSFDGLRGGAIELLSGGALPSNYAVYQNAQPPLYSDGLDSPGTTGGVADNASHQVNPQVSIFQQTLVTKHTTSGARDGDLLFAIPLGIGQTSQQNNFGEILMPMIPPCTDCVPELPPPPELVIVPPPAPTPLPPPLIITPPDDVLLDIGGGMPFTWHLSIVDGGLPRDDSDLVVDTNAVWFTASYLDQSNWRESRLDRGSWLLAGDEQGTEVLREWIFGIADAKPISGDFNGDGIDEIAVFFNGEWFIDLNGNGHWDEEDLWVQLGKEHDQPVTGDWDGDGKDDIGIFGPQWPGDPRAISHEPGLPDAENAPKHHRPKNVPPKPDEATIGNRVMRRTEIGEARADLIDHVFRYGVAKMSPFPVIGMETGLRRSDFRNGNWRLDTNGDGRWSSADQTVQFGQTGDIPVVGDFDGNGVADVGVFRDGTWIIDSNGNRELDAHDKVFEMGGAGDVPVVGDWDGDGIDEPAIYRSTSANPTDQASR